MALPTALAWPDIVVGPGLLDGSMVSCLEKLLIDTEAFRFARQGYRGVVTDEEKWLTDAIKEVEPGARELRPLESFAQGELSPRGSRAGG